MAEVTAADVKALREQTGAAMMDCKKALVEADGDIDKAIEALRIKGAASAAKRGDREASEGLVAEYIHANGKIGVLVEIDCETDFVAQNADFVAFAKEVASHIAAAQPRWVSQADVPDEVRDSELRIFEQESADKPEEIRAKIAAGKLAKWYTEVVLLDQPHINPEKHDGRTISEMLHQIAATTGENVVIRRFARFAIGD